MDVRTFRAASLQAALQQVRKELGPEAAVLHTREVGRSGVWGWIAGRRFEVTASAEVHVPSRFAAPEPTPAPIPAASDAGPGSDEIRARYRDDLKSQLSDLQSMVADLCRRTAHAPGHELPAALFPLFTDLIEADVHEDLARELVERVRREVQGDELNNPVLLKARIARQIEQELSVSGPLAVSPGRCRVVALVGPTGVGKTTTIAKLAAIYRLREKRRVGFITVDTYRIAAVEQLRTYADIIDLPMEVVSTPREMREAARRLSNLDLVLIDTAGRSPRDEVKLQELKAMLGEAQADEVHLVLSSVASAASLASTAEKFAPVGTTALILTKLDESSGLGNLLPLLRASKLPLSYLTNGQNVPEDIEPAERRRLARAVLGMDMAAVA